jgi:hypothetical protein
MTLSQLERSSSQLVRSKIFTPRIDIDKSIVESAAISKDLARSKTPRKAIFY